jgi:hypothetical protein
MSSAIVVDLGSSAVKCGLANSYLTDTQPSVVSALLHNMFGSDDCCASEDLTDSALRGCFCR